MEFDELNHSKRQIRFQPKQSSRDHEPFPISFPAADLLPSTDLALSAWHPGIHPSVVHKRLWAGTHVDTGHYLAYLMVYCCY
jgi:hypothetical protein